MTNANQVGVNDLLVTLESLATRLESNRMVRTVTRAEAALEEQRASQLRQGLLPPQWQSHVTWNMLIELYLYRLQDRLANVKQITLGSGASPTTAQRHISALVESSWVQRETNRRDHRVVNLWLTEQAAEVIDEWLDKRIAQRKTWTPSLLL